MTTEDRMTAKHTPGPWHAHDDDGTGTLPCVLSDQVNAGGNFYVAQCNVFADARLIAAAPEMLALLREWAHVADMGTITMERAARRTRALLARIEMAAPQPTHSPSRTLGAPPGYAVCRKCGETLTLHESVVGVCRPQSAAREGG